MRNLRDTIFYLKTNELQDFHFCISVPLMTVHDFSGFFSRDHFLEGGFTFQWGG